MSSPAVHTTAAASLREVAARDLSRLPSPASRYWTLLVHTLREQWRSILIWGVSLGLLSVLYVALYPGFKESLGAYLETMPESYLQFLGIEVGAEMSLKSFLNMEMFAVIAPLALPFFAILIGARTVAGAEDRLQLDMLLGNPIPRWQLIMSRFASMAVGLVVILALLWVFTWLPTPFLDESLPPLDLFWAVLNLVPFSLVFGGLALVLSALLRRSALAIAIPAALLVAMYVVNGLAGSVPSFADARYASLFHYYGSAIMDGIDWLSFLVLLALSLALALLAVPLFRRRDILT
jgi:ABC-2 type transport system permease protein